MSNSSRQAFMLVGFAFAGCRNAPAHSRAGLTRTDFGNNGWAIIPFAGATTPNDMRVDPSGRIVIAARNSNDNGASQILFTRVVASTGLLDETFGQSGFLTIADPDNVYAFASAIG